MPFVIIIISDLIVKQHRYTTFLLTAAFAVCACSCHSSRQNQTAALTEIPSQVDGITETPQIIKPGTKIDVPLHSVIFKADSQYACNVPVSVTPSGNAVIFMPSPSDAKVAPVKLADGYWLATMPLGQQSVFTDYSYKAYAELAQRPSASEMLGHVIAGAKPTVIVQLPEEMSDTVAINKLIREGLPGCTTLR